MELENIHHGLRRKGDLTVEIRSISTISASQMYEIYFKSRTGCYSQIAASSKMNVRTKANLWSVGFGTWRKPFPWRPSLHFGFGGERAVWS